MIDEAQAARCGLDPRAGHNVEVVCAERQCRRARPDCPYSATFISEGVDAIIHHRNSPKAFDPVVRAGQGKPGPGDSRLTPKCRRPTRSMSAYDQTAMGCCRRRNGWLRPSTVKARSVAFTGVGRSPGNEMRVAGYRSVFEQHPGIEVVNEVNANWDQARRASRPCQNIPATNADIQRRVGAGNGMAARRLALDHGRGQGRRDRFADRRNPQGLHPICGPRRPKLPAPPFNSSRRHGFGDSMSRCFMLEGRELKEPATGGPVPATPMVPADSVHSSSENLPKAAAQVEGQPGH